MIGCSKKNEKIIRENAFKQKTKNPGLKFNPGLALIGLLRTGSRITNHSEGDMPSFQLEHNIK